MKKHLALLAGLSALLVAPVAFAQSGADADLDGVPNDMDAFPCDPGPSAVRFFPGQGKFATMFFEDQWPSRGDNDFNDVVLAYNFILTTNAQGQVYQIRVNYNALAIGGVFNNGLALHLPVPVSQVASVTRQIGGAAVESLNPETSDPDLVIRALDNVRQLYGNQAGTINSDPTLPTRTAAPLELVIRFTQPVAMDLSRVPFDTFIFRTQDFGHQIHRPEYVGTAAVDALLFQSEDDGSDSSRHYVDQSGLPFALLVPASTLWPQEGVSISRLFPGIALFASSGGAQGADFYQAGVQPNYGWSQGSDGLTAPSPSFVGAPDEPGNGACIVPWRHGGAEYGGSGNETTWQSFASDSLGNILIAGSTDRTIPGGTSAGYSDEFLMKYSPQGSLLWSRQRGTSGGDYANGVAVDSANNIYVVGTVIYKYDPSGNLLWTRTNPVGCVDYQVNAVAIAPDGNLMITGACLNGIGTSTADMPWGGWNCWTALTLKLSAANGSQIWGRAGDRGDVSTSIGTSVAVDSAGNSYSLLSEYICGNVDPRTVYHHMLIKRDSTGKLLYAVPLDNQRMTNSGQVRVSGDAVVVSFPFSGTVNGVTSKGSYDIGVQKLAASDGHMIWMSSVGTAGNEYSYSGSSGANTIDSWGNIYIGGTTDKAFAGFTSYGLADYFIAKLDASGAVLWTTQYGTSANDYGTGVGWEPFSNMVYIGGMTQGAFAGSTNAGGWDVFLMKHNPVNGGVL